MFSFSGTSEFARGPSPGDRARPVGGLHRGRASPPTSRGQALTSSPSNDALGGAPQAYVAEASSGRETVAVVVALLGGVLASAFFFGGKRYDGPVPMWPNGVYGGLAVLVGALVSRAAMHDCRLVDPATRTVWEQRSFITRRTRRALASFDDCIELIVSDTKHRGRRGWYRTWTLWLVVNDAPTLPLCTFPDNARVQEGVPAVPPDPVADGARRVAELLGVPVAREHDFDPAQPRRTTSNGAGAS